MKISDATHHSPTRNPPPVLSPNSPTPAVPPRQGHVAGALKLPHRRTVKLVGDRRSGRHGAPARRISVPATPILRWKFDDAGDFSVPRVTVRRCFRRVKGEWVAADNSVRKLAADLWQSTPEFTSVVGGTSSQSEPFNHVRYKHQSSVFATSAMEGATNLDHRCSKSSTEVGCLYNNTKLSKNQKVDSISVVSALQAKLVQARMRIQELESKQWYSKKKVELFLRKLGEERASRKRKEDRKLCAVIDKLKDELKRERKNFRQMEIVSSKLLSDLGDAKLSAKKYVQDYERERKARELLEEVCNGLAERIEKDQAEVKAKKREAARIHEELEEERKMLHMAEIWREERVQMKLLDAKLVLEEKYSQLNNLIADVETFLGSRDIVQDMINVREALNSMDILDIKEFSHMPSKSNDTHLIVENLQNGEGRGKEGDRRINYSPARNALEINAAIPEINGLNKNLTEKKHLNGLIERGGRSVDTGGWETQTLTRARDQNSSYTANGSDCSIDRIGGGRTEHEQDHHADQECFNSEISEISSESAKQSRKKALSVCNPLRIPEMEVCVEWPRGMKRYILKGKKPKAKAETVLFQRN